MTPEPILSVPDVEVQGLWDRQRVRGSATLVLLADGWQLRDQYEARLSLGYAGLTDATWERETLTLHRGEEALALRGPRGLSRAWGVVVEQACELPEVARGLRTLGTAHGGSATLQARFFGPLLAARRRLQAPDALERRVTQFDAAALTQRLSVTIAEIAAERHKADAPRRRSLEAHLEEAVEPLLAHLAQLGDATEGLHRAGPGARFAEWRLWTAQLRRVFLAADRAWAHIILHLEPR